jgi:hypothetical protein
MEERTTSKGEKRRAGQLALSDKDVACLSSATDSPHAAAPAISS